MKTNLSLGEMEALRRAVSPFTGVDDDTVVRLTLAALAAVPRLAGDRLAEATQQRDEAVAIARGALLLALTSDDAYEQNGGGDNLVSLGNRLAALTGEVG